jgi:hypothetical protein
MKISMVLVIFLSVAVFSQDPGNPDSLIIGVVEVPEGVPSVMVPVYAVTDDSVAQFILPIQWSSPDSQVHPAGVYYFNQLLLWDEVNDSIDIDNNHLLITGVHDTGGDENPVLLTDYQRLVVMRIRVVIHPDAVDQLVPISTYVDPFYGPAVFGLVDGSTSFSPTITDGGVTYGQVGIDDKQTLPSDFTLNQNYPNPFNTKTEIRFCVPSRSLVTLDIYDLLGRKVNTLVSGNLEAGYYSANWDGTDQQGNPISSGLYFYTLKSGDVKLSRKMVMLK